MSGAPRSGERQAPAPQVTEVGGLFFYALCAAAPQSGFLAPQAYRLCKASFSQRRKGAKFAIILLESQPGLSNHMVCDQYGHTIEVISLPRGFGESPGQGWLASAARSASIARTEQ